MYFSDMVVGFCLFLGVVCAGYYVWASRTPSRAKWVYPRGVGERGGGAGDKAGGANPIGIW